MSTYYLHLDPSFPIENAWDILTESGYTPLYSEQEDEKNGIVVESTLPLNVPPFTWVLSIEPFQLPPIDWTEQWALFGPNFNEGRVQLDLKPFFENKPGTVHSFPLVTMEPGCGFGDFSHPTTHLMMQLLTECLPLKTVIDIGSGSGILSLAAAVMGAKKVIGIDIDEGAIAHAIKNAIINDVQKTCHFMAPCSANDYLKECEPQALTLMNMISSEQKIAYASLPSIHSLQGTLITSGIRNEEKTSYATQIEEWGWKIEKTYEKEGWLAFLCSRLPVISLLLLSFSACTSPIYQNTTYPLEEFAAESVALQKVTYSPLAQTDDSSLSQKKENNHNPIGEGDILSISLWSATRKDKIEMFETISKGNGFKVMNGKVFLPGIPPVEVEGLCINEAKEKLTALYRKDINDAKIYIHFKEQKKQLIYLVGARNPIVPVHGEMPLYEVLARGQIPAHANLYKSYCMREDEKLRVDLYRLIHEGDESQNILMKGGDKIFIASAKDATVLVTGEVPMPLVIPLIYGALPLREALALSGGIPYTGNKGSITVIRAHPTRPRIFSFAWKETLFYDNSSLLLIPGDIVVISERPLTEWNRFVDQLQPSGDCMQTTLDYYGLCRGCR